MKKIFLSMLMLVAAGTAFAQMTPEEKAALKAAQKEAKAQTSQGIKLRDEVSALYQANQAEAAKGENKDQEVIDKNAVLIKQKSLQANELLAKALKSGHVAHKQLFDANKALDDVSTQLLNPELNLAANKQTFDTLTFAKSVDGVCQGCYGQLEYGNPKDEFQKPVLASAKLKMPKLITYYAYLCIFYTETKNLEGAMAAYEKYANFAQTYPKVANEPEVANPQYPVSQFAFNLYYTAYTLKRYDLCEKFYKEALQFPDEGSHNFVVSSRPQIYLQQGDTAKWIVALEEMIAADPASTNAEVATQNLLAHYSKKGPQAMSDFADKMLAKDPNNKMANYGKGHSLFSQEKYNEALPFFKKSVEADPEYVDGYNMCGMALYRQAAENYYKQIDGKKFKTTAELNKAEEKLVKSLYREAATYFETCREKAADKPELWAGPLQTIYKNLGQKAKAAELDQYTK
jgi:tetratricopeptide (TPR) repeat protein